MGPIISTVFTLLCIILEVFAARWSSNDYPNPRTNSRGCGNSSPAQICDPDGILPQSSRSGMANRLKEATRSTQGAYKGNSCQQKGITVYMALADSIQPSSGGQVSDADQQSFAEGLKNKWQLDSQCSKGLVISVSKSDRKFWIAKEKNVPIPSTTFTTIFNRHKGQFASNMYAALLGIVNDIEREYQNLGRSGTGTYGSNTNNQKNQNTNRGSSNNQGGYNRGGGYSNNNKGGSGSGSAGDAMKIIKKG